MPSAAEKPTYDQFVGTSRLKKKLIDHLAKLESLAQKGQWEHLQTHTSHPDSAFDWWMFPSDQASRGQGKRYTVNSSDILRLTSDPEFMHAYRKGVCLVAKSWGWDLEHKRNVTTNTQCWTGYTIRLEKMLYSLRLFGQNDLRKTLSQFVTERNIPLNSWAAACLCRN
jgi:hypothetical protein